MQYQKFPPNPYKDYVKKIFTEVGLLKRFCHWLFLCPSMTFFLNYIAKEKGYRSPLPAKDIILDISPTPPKKEKKSYKCNLPPKRI